LTQSGHPGHFPHLFSFIKFSAVAKVVSMRPIFVTFAILSFSVVTFFSFTGASNFTIFVDCKNAQVGFHILAVKPIYVSQQSSFDYARHS
jgi:hypothetical protein